MIDNPGVLKFFQAKDPMGVREIKQVPHYILDKSE